MEGDLYIGGCIYFYRPENSRGACCPLLIWQQGNLTSWNPGSNGVIYGLAGWKKCNVCFRAIFNNRGGNPETTLLQLITSSATATAWNINVNNYVLDLAVV
jgi:hypothetical protein